MAVIDTLRLTHNKLLLVEGEDEVNFFKAMLKKIGKTDEVQIIAVGGKENFKNELTAIINLPGFSDVETIGIVRDADNSVSSAFQSVASLLRNNGLFPPSNIGSFSNGYPKVGIYIMPDNSENGMLEDLCLQTQKDHPLMQCIEAYFQCVVSKEVDQPRNMSKAKSQIFLASMPKLVNSVGLGAQKGYWNLEHECLKDLTNFLDELFRENLSTVI